MATLVGYIAEAWNSTGQAVLSLSALTAPGGGTVSAAAGQMAVVEASHAETSRPLPDDWKSFGDSLWWKMLTAADITAGSVTVRSWLTSLTVLSGAAGLGRRTDQPQVKVSSANGGAIFRGYTGRWDTSTLAPAAYRLGAQTQDPDDKHQHGVYWRPATAAGYLALPSASDDADWRAYEVLAPAAPLAPQLLMPAAGSSVDRAKAIDLAVGHQSAAGLPQTGIKVIIRATAPTVGPWGSVKADGTLAAGDTSQELTQASGVVTLAAGVLAAATQYEWAAYTRDTSGWSPVSASWTLAARSVPTATITMTTTAGDLSPTLSGTITPGTGTPRAIYLRVCPAADGTSDGFIWESGQIATTATSYSVEVPASEIADLWVNGSSYRAWILPMDIALDGAWTQSAPAAVSWTPPAAPTAITAVDGSPPRLTVTGVLAGTVRLEVWAAPVGLDVWRPVADVASTGVTTVVLRDPLSVFAVRHRYRTRRWALVDTVAVSSSWVESAEMTSNDMAAYAVAADRSSYVQVVIVDAGALVPIQGVTRSTGMGDTVQRIDKTVVAGFESWWLCDVATADDEATLRGWVTDPDRPSMRLRPPPERMNGIVTDTPSLLTASASRPSVERPSPGTNLSSRRIKWDWITQEEEL